MSIQLNTYTSQLYVQSTTVVEVFHASTGSKQIVCGANSVLNYLIIVSDAQVQIDVSHLTGSQATIRAIVVSSGAPTSLKLTSTLVESQASSDVHIVSYCTPHSDITVDGNIVIVPQVSGSAGHLLEQNILLGGKTKLRTLPVLDVRSNDISASHGAQVDRIDPMQMFYCMSRGLDRQRSTQLIIDSMIRSMTSHIESDVSVTPLTTTLSHHILSLIGISGPQHQAPSNRSHRVSHHLPSIQLKPLETI